MPFQIIIAIDPSRRIRKFIENYLAKKKEKNSLESTKSDQCSEKEVKSSPIAVYRSTNYNPKAREEFLVAQKESGKEGKDSSIFAGAGGALKNDEIFKKTSSDIESNANKKLIIVEPKRNIPGFVRRLFSFSKKRENPSQTDIIPTEPNRTCDNAVNAFNSLLEDDKSLEALVGKAFSLNTMVTIQSIEDDGKPNLILSGSIPFKVTTKHGIINKKVHVKGKLYSPRKEEENQSCRDDKSYCSTQSMVRVKINRQFRVDCSKIEKVRWLTSQIFTQEEYQQVRHYNRRLFDVPKVQTLGNANLKRKVSNHDGHERLRYVTDIDERDPSLNIIESGHLKSYHSCDSAFENKHVQLPVTSITIARSKTRLIRFSDGTDFTEKVGRNVITLEAPEGVLYLKGENQGDGEDNFFTVGGKKHLGVDCNDNMFTRKCYQVAKLEDEYALSRSINCAKRLGREISKKRDREIKVIDPHTYYPPGNYSHILVDRYNPLTWIYQNFDKTKRFVQEFSC